MVAFVGKYCVSELFSTEEGFVRKTGHRGITQSLGQNVGKWLGSPIPGREQGQSKESHQSQLGTLLGGQVPGLLISRHCM